MASVSFKQATKYFPGASEPAVAALDLDVDDGEFLVLVGPSGCGKSTTLRMLAGLEDVDEGSIEIDGQDVTTVSPANRDIAMVFQSYALYPHMTVAQNMEFALRISKVPREERRKRVEEAARLLEVESLLDRRPVALSGGQRQRVAMGRAIVRRPRVFLMDEPLSNLDAKLRVQTRAEIGSLQRRLRVTTIYVTHDQVEAMTLGDRVAVMKDGILQQVDSPRVLYDSPANLFVAGFMGSPSMNLHESAVIDGHASISCYRIPVKTKGDDGRVVIGFRPESLELAGDGEDAFSMVVDVVEELGGDSYVYGRLEDSGGALQERRIIARLDPQLHAPGKGGRVRLTVRNQECHFFSPATGERLVG